MRISFLVLFSLFINSYAFSSLRSDDRDPNLSKYEFGLSLAHVSYPKYPGSRESEELTLPVPLFLYRGHVIRSDEDGGLRGRFLKNERFEINLSLGGSPPASSDDIKAREGMPSLPFILEVGPGLIYKIIRPTQTNHWSLSLNLPLRIPIAFNDFNTDDRGLVFNPILYGYYNFIPEKLQSFFFLSYRWGNREYNETYYQVGQQFETSIRSNYQAQSGTVAAAALAGLTYKINNRWSVAGAYAVEDLSGNANRSSPLFEKDFNQFYFLALNWTFYKSEEKQRVK